MKKSSYANRCKRYLKGAIGNNELFTIAVGDLGKIEKKAEEGEGE